jgi:hypothetical protein
MAGGGDQWRGELAIDPVRRRIRRGASAVTEALLRCSEGESLRSELPRSGNGTAQPSAMSRAASREGNRNRSPTLTPDKSTPSMTSAYLLVSVTETRALRAGPRRLSVTIFLHAVRVVPQGARYRRVSQQTLFPARLPAQA